MDSLKRLFEGLSPASAFLAGFIMLALVGVLDYITGSEYSFSIFFLVPVIAVTWQAGRTAGMITCLLAAVSWLVAEELGDRAYSNELIPVWNALVRLGFFLVVAFLVARVKKDTALESELARTDPLTGIANSRQFFEVCRIEIERSRRSARPLTVAFMDVDSFKLVNDKLGHSQGDELLRYVAGKMTAALRSTDLVARMGGDEFVLLLTETPGDDARLIIERLHGRLSEGMEDHDWPAGFSFGVATFNTAPESVDEVLRKADALMYDAKQAAGASIRFSTFD